MGMGISSLKQLWRLPPRVSDMPRPHLILLRTVISEFAKSFPGKTVLIPHPVMVKGTTYNQTDAPLLFGATQLARLKGSLPNTFMPNDHRAIVILSVYWTVVQWLVYLVSTVFTLPLSATHISSDFQFWHSTLTLTLHRTRILTRVRYCCILGDNGFTLHTLMSADVCAAWNKSVVNHKLVQVLVLFKLTNNMGVNLLLQLLKFHHSRTVYKLFRGTSGMFACLVDWLSANAMYN